MSEKLFRFPFTGPDDATTWSVLYCALPAASTGCQVYGSAFWDDAAAPVASSDGGGTFSRRFPCRRTVRR
jgi:hypothetical protein